VVPPCVRPADKLYKGKLDEYYGLNKKEAVAYSFYACSTTTLPNLVTSLVLFYGGKLVLQGDISSGKLVSFLLYLSSLSDAFNNMGSIFSAFTQALGAADKGRAVHMLTGPPSLLEVTRGMLG
jgi:ATP-binding cassette, subfamily B (MDR/TAP), member 9